MCATEIKLLLLLVCLGSVLFAINNWNLSSPLARPNASPSMLLYFCSVSVSAFDALHTG